MISLPKRHSAVEVRVRAGAFSLADVKHSLQEVCPELRVRRAERTSGETLSDARVEQQVREGRLGLTLSPGPSPTSERGRHGVLQVRPLEQLVFTRRVQSPQQLWTVSCQTTTQ